MLDISSWDRGYECLNGSVVRYLDMSAASFVP
jgi:hypothetical protein